MSVPQPRGTLEAEDETLVANSSNEVIATELRLFKEELMRMMADYRDELRSMRQDMSSNYVHHKVYQSDQARQDDRTHDLDSDMLEVKTTIGAMGVELHGHIDRRVDEVTVLVNKRCDDIAGDVEKQASQRRFTWQQASAWGTAVLLAVVALIAAFAQHH